jgi:putative MATE family efflux protein
MLTVALNVVLTPILVAGWGPGPALGVVGAGLSSTLAAATGFVAMSLYFVRFEGYVRFDVALLRPRREILGRMLAVGLPAGGEFVLLFVYMAVVYSVISRFGATTQAGFGVGMRLMNAVFVPAIAIAFAIPAIVGQNFGAKDASRVRETFRTAVLINVALMVALTLFCKWRPEWLVGSFGSDAEVVRVAAVFLSVISWNFVAYALNVSCSGMFQGMGNTLPSLASAATRVVTFVVPVFYLARQPDFTVEQVWYLSVATVAFQAVVSLGLVRWQLAKRLRFDTVKK